VLPAAAEQFGEDVCRFRQKRFFFNFSCEGNFSKFDRRAKHLPFSNEVKHIGLNSVPRVAGRSLFPLIVRDTARDVTVRDADFQTQGQIFPQVTWSFTTPAFRDLHSNAGCQGRWSRSRAWQRERKK